MRVRFSIAGVMAAVLLIAVGFAGLHIASPLWASAVFTLTVTLLAAAAVGAAACRGPSRFAWLGFAVFGWIYVLATFWLWPQPNGATAPPFLTKFVLDAFQPPLETATVMTVDPGPTGEMTTEPPAMVATPIPGTVGLNRLAPFAGRVINLRHYRRIGHSLAAIGFGLLGGVLGTIFSALNRDSVEQRPSRREGMRP